MKWLAGIGIAVLAVLGLGWLFRAEIALFGIHQMMSAEIGPTQPVTWSTGADPQGRDASERPPNIVLILADDLG